MLKHVILWQFNDDLTDEQKEELKQQIQDDLEALPGKIPGLIDVNVYIDGLPTSNADWFLDVTLESKAALEVYAKHPDHVAVAERLILPNCKTRLCMDFEVGRFEQH